MVNEKSIIRFMYSILNDKKTANRYLMTQMRDRETGEVTATYDDCLDYLENKYSELNHKEEVK